MEYDFVPQDLTVEAGDYLHFQWTGSDANAKGNAGNGRQSTDRSNLVQLSSRQDDVIGCHLPCFLAFVAGGERAAGVGPALLVGLGEDSSSFQPRLFDARANPNDNDGKALLTRRRCTPNGTQMKKIERKDSPSFAQLCLGLLSFAQLCLGRFAYLDQMTNLCDVDDNDQNSVQNCKQLNGATAYFDGGAP